MPVGNSVILIHLGLLSVKLIILQVASYVFVIFLQIVLVSGLFGLNDVVYQVSYCVVYGCSWALILFLCQGIVIGVGENSEFGEVFKMMQNQEVAIYL